MPQYKSHNLRKQLLSCVINPSSHNTHSLDSFEKLKEHNYTATLSLPVRTLVHLTKLGWTFVNSSKKQNPTHAYSLTVHVL